MHALIRGALALAVAVPLMAQAPAVDPALLSEMQGMWVSRFADHAGKIEIRGDEVYLLDAGPVSNAPPLGLIFKIETVTRTWPDASTKMPSYKFGGQCLSWNGTKYQWFPASSGCSLSFTSTGTGLTAKRAATRVVDTAYASSMVRADIKAAWKAAGKL